MEQNSNLQKEGGFASTPKKIHFSQTGGLQIALLMLLCKLKEKRRRI
jgi:hypothetical protein